MVDDLRIVDQVMAKDRPEFTDLLNAHLRTGGVVVRLRLVPPREAAQQGIAVLDQNRTQSRVGPFLWLPFLWLALFIRTRCQMLAASSTSRC